MTMDLFLPLMKTMYYRILLHSYYIQTKRYQKVISCNIFKINRAFELNLQPIFPKLMLAELLAQELLIDQ